MKTFHLILSGLTLATAVNAQQKKPNIIIILADDLGFSDIGCFGGEINTPNLDKLAKTGVRFTQMYNSARSCPSRASLLTGLYPHQAGLGQMDGGKKNWPKGYSGFRSNDNVIIPEVLKQAGYMTAMSGKWHLGNEATPTERGFDEFFGMLGGFGSFWSQKPYSRLPNNRTPRVYSEDEFYSTNAITDYALDFINQAKTQKQPLFLYLAYNAPHFPLHAPKDVTDKYMKTYLQGWDKIRDSRWKRIANMGILQGKPTLSPRGQVTESLFMDKTYDLPAWNSLTVEQQTDLARRMSIFAAMVDIMDKNIGRVIKTLKDNKELENTFIVFLSDNGACAEWHEFGFDGKTGTDYKIHTGTELDEMGLKNSYLHYGTGWANVCNTPFTLYKHFAHEGGISTPCIVSYGKKVAQKGGINHTPMHFSDIMATCMELSGATYPDTKKGNTIVPLAGRSFLPAVIGDTLAERPIFAEHEGNRMVRLGDWKLVSAHFRGENWELYNIVQDRTEQHNLAAQYPEKVKSMEKMYFEWADKSDVLYFPTLWNTYSKNNKKFKEYKTK